MNKEFIPYEQALELKELGFDEECYGHYNSMKELNTAEDYKRLGVNISEMLSKKFNSVLYMKEVCSAPLYQQAFRWFREKYKIQHTIRHHAGLYEYLFDYGFNHYYGDYESYEEAELACLKKLIEIVKNK